MKRIVVGSLDAARRFHPAPGERYGILSFIDSPSGPESRAPRIPRKPGFVVRLVVEADDCEPADERDSTGHLQMIALTAHQAQQIAKFVRECEDRIDTLVVHCVAGLSRSPGAAVAIAEALGIEEIEGVSLGAIPNGHVRTLLTQAFAQYPTRTTEAAGVA